MYYVRFATHKKQWCAVMDVAKHYVKIAGYLISGAMGAGMAIPKPSVKSVTMIQPLISGKHPYSYYCALFTEAKVRCIPFLKESFG